MSFSDEDLIEACSKGKRKAQEELYARYSSKMYPIALRYSKMHQEAEDILQEAFIKVFKNIKDFRKDSSLDFSFCV